MKNQVTFVMVFLLPLGIHLFHLSNSVFTLCGKLKGLFLNFLKAAFARIYLFILPYAALLGILVLLIMFIFIPLGVLTVVLFRQNGMAERA